MRGFRFRELLCMSGLFVANRCYTSDREMEGDIFLCSKMNWNAWMRNGFL